MIIDDLRSSTKQAHQTLDNALMPAFKNLDSEDKYKQLLSNFYASFKPLQDKIRQHLSSEDISDLDNRRTVDKLEEDLRFLNVDPAGIELNNDYDFIKDKASALGAQYVLEGSTMGGVYLAKAISKQLPMEPGKGLSYFHGYGENTRSMWDTFIEKLNTEGAKYSSEDIVGGANKTFEAVHGHLAK